MTDSPPAVGPQSLVGVVLSNRYRIDRLIGEGGMGAVYQAEHVLMHKRVAVKVLHPEMSHLPEIVARFEREAMAAAHIDHPNVATASDFGKLPDGSFFLVLEYIEGRSLRELLTDGALAPGRALHIAKQIADALGRAHALGIVHRDLKPENVMILSRDGDPDFVKVLDFGIAKVPVGELGTGPTSGAPRPVLTRLGAVFGTPDYMSPEQALGQSVDGRADLYSLGILLFEMLTGVVPFEHENAATVLSMHVGTPAPSIASKAHQEIPGEIEAIVSRTLAKDAGARFQDAKEMVLAITTAKAGLSDDGPVASLRAGAAKRVMDPSTSARTHAAISASDIRLAQLVATVETQGQRAFVGARDFMGRTDKKTQLVAAAGVLGILGTLCLLVFFVAGGKSTPRAERAEPLGSGSAANAPTQVAPVERANVHRDLERTDMESGDVRGALGEAGEWLKTDPAAATDARLAADLRTMALGQETSDAAMALLASMGPPGIDALYDVAYNTGPGAASARARKALAAPGVASRASPSLAVTLELRGARSCDKKKALLERAGELGDARTLAALREYQPTTGCGFLGMKDCWSCMHRDDALASTVKAIQERVRGD